MMQPELSIIITNYNYSQYLKACIEGCIHQETAVPYEVIMVDDGSTDDSLKCIEPYLSDTVRLLVLENSGIEVASNQGFSASKGQFVVRVDADDYLLPTYVDKMVPVLKQEDACAFVYPDYHVIDGQGDLLYDESLPSFSPEEILKRGDFLATGTLYRKSVLEAFAYYDETVKNCGLENYQLIVKLIQAGYSGLHVAGHLFSYRRHNANISANRKADIWAYGRHLFSNLGIGTYQTNCYHPYKLELDYE